MMAMKRTVVALLWIAALIVSHIRFGTSFATYRPGALHKVESSRRAQLAGQPCWKAAAKTSRRFNLQGSRGPVGGARCRCGHETELEGGDMAGDLSLTGSLRLTSCLLKSTWRVRAAVLHRDRGAAS
jgi:hypothetical protein